VLGKPAGAVEIARLHVRVDDHALGLFVIGARGNEGGFLGDGLLGPAFQVVHQTGGDVAVGDDAHQPVVGIQNRETAKAVPVEFRHSADQGEMIAQTSRFCGSSTVRPIR